MKKKTFVIGLTGSIGMGKSAATRMFARLGAHVFHADKVVHDLLLPEGAAFKKVSFVFPQSLWRGKISKKRLARTVFSDPAKLKKLEDLLHPLVWQACKKAIQKAQKKEIKAVVLEIPLLFETGEDKKCDATICLSASSAIQKERVLRRKNMTPAKLRAILSQQMPDAEKRKRADFVVRTDKGFADTRKQIIAIWNHLCESERHA